jgi:hypothetical protein
LVKYAPCSPCMAAPSVLAVPIRVSSYRNVEDGRVSAPAPSGSGPGSAQQDVVDGVPAVVGRVSVGVFAPEQLVAAVVTTSLTFPKTSSVSSALP